MEKIPNYIAFCGKTQYNELDGWDSSAAGAESSCTRPAYAIGSTQSGTTYAETWVGQVLEIRDTYDIDLPIYIYNLDRFTCEDYAETDVYCSGGVYNLYAVMYDFADGAEMAPYQNWTGRCDITHKTILFGPGGWMQELSAVEGWGLLLDEEKCDYYYDYMTFWVR